MNVPALQPDVGWSRGRWLTVLLLLAAGQGLAVWLLARWPRLPEPGAGGGALFQLEFPGAGTVSSDPLLGDPRQFAAVDPEGFSGAAWRALPPAEYALAEWAAVPRWLAGSPRPERLGSVPEAKAAPKPRVSAPAWLPIVKDGSAAPLLPTNSTVWPRGVLAVRPLLNPAPVPVLAGSDVLNPSLVEVAVAPAGGVMLARLTGSSGNREADQVALAWARQARFQPEGAAGAAAMTDPGQFAWGELAFLWRVEPSTR